MGGIATEYAAVIAARAKTSRLEAARVKAWRLHAPDTVAGCVTEHQQRKQ